MPRLGVIIALDTETDANQLLNIARNPTSVLPMRGTNSTVVICDSSNLLIVEFRKSADSVLLFENFTLHFLSSEPPVPCVNSGQPMDNQRVVVEN